MLSKEELVNKIKNDLAYFVDIRGCNVKYETTLEDKTRITFLVPTEESLSMHMLPVMSAVDLVKWINNVYEQ